MTLISFFDEDPLDNVGDLLYFRPARCVFLGQDAVMTKRRRRCLQEFARSRGLETELQFRSLPERDFEGALERLRELAEEYPDCVLDVTGGTEMLLAAAGAVAGAYDLPMYQLRSRTGELLWQWNCRLEPMPAGISVRELVGLHGGSVFDSGLFQEWSFTDRLRQDILGLWEIARTDPAAWNTTCMALEVMSQENLAEDPLQVAVTTQAGAEAARQLNEAILASLLVAGYITDFDGDWGGLSFRFRDENIRRILGKAGNLLELYTCLAADWADDREIGVPLDWDGVRQPVGTADTYNELDIMLTCGLTPVCISCKNGVFTKDALYELETVARQFGGRYAKKILIATYINRSQAARESLEQRARDMHITLIADVDQLSLEELSRRLRKAVQ